MDDDGDDEKKKRLTKKMLPLQDFTKVQNILAGFPTVEKMTQAKDFFGLKLEMDKKDPLAFPLLQWLLLMLMLMLLLLLLPCG